MLEELSAGCLTISDLLVWRSRERTQTLPVVVAGNCEDHRFVGFDVLDFVSPFASNLHGQVRDLGARVHGKCHVES